MTLTSKTTIKLKKMFKTNTLKTPCRIEKEAKDLLVAEEWDREMAKPGAMATAVNQHCMEKFGIYSPSNIWAIRKRVAKRLIEEAQPV